MPYTLLLPSEMFNAQPQCSELVEYSEVPIIFADNVATSNGGHGKIHRMRCIRLINQALARL